MSFGKSIKILLYSLIHEIRAMHIVLFPRTLTCTVIRTISQFHDFLLVVYFQRNNVCLLKKFSLKTVKFFAQKNRLTSAGKPSGLFSILLALSKATTSPLFNFHKPFALSPNNNNRTTR